MRASTPALTSFLSRSARMWRAMPSRASNASNRRTRRKQSRRISSVQRSPITDTVRATEHGSRLSSFQRMPLSRAHFAFDKAPRPDARCQGSFLERTGGTMPRVVEFYFDYGSPYSYIAHTRLREVLRRTGGDAPHPIIPLGGRVPRTR